MGFNSCRPLRVLDLCSESPALGPLSKRRWPGWTPLSFPPREWASACKWFTWGTEGTRVHHGKKASKWLQIDAFNDILLTNMLLMSVVAPLGVSVRTVLATKNNIYFLWAYYRCPNSAMMHYQTNVSLQLLLLTEKKQEIHIIRKDNNFLDLIFPFFMLIRFKLDAPCLAFSYCPLTQQISHHAFLLPLRIS